MKGNEAAVKQKRRFMAPRMPSLFPWQSVIEGHRSAGQNKQPWRVPLNILMLLLPFCLYFCVFPLIFFFSSQGESCKSWNSKLQSKYLNVANHFKASQNEALSLFNMAVCQTRLMLRSASGSHPSALLIFAFHQNVNQDLDTSTCQHVSVTAP